MSATQAPPLDVARAAAEQDRRQFPSLLHHRANVGRIERFFSVLAGADLVKRGLLRGRWSGLAMAAFGGGCLYRGLTGHCQTYQLLGINRDERRNADVVVPAQQGFKYETAILIQRPPALLYEVWRHLDLLAPLFHPLAQVTVGNNGRSHWVVPAPLGQSVEWDAEVFNEQPDSLIAWRTVPGSQLDMAGSVRFDAAPADRGTVVSVSLKYDPPGGKLGAQIAEWLNGGAKHSITEGLRRVKRIMEAGQILSTANQPRGTCCS